jgi:5'-3' exoribonuclease 2
MPTSSCWVCPPTSQTSTSSGRASRTRRWADQKAIVIDQTDRTDTPIVVNSSNFTIRFSIVKLLVFRDFLHGYMKDVGMKFAYNLENVIDDFVLLCFLVGNDFLPHLPGLDIRVGGIDILLGFYKKTLGKLKGYLTDQNEVNLENFELFLKDLGRVEFELLKKLEENSYQNVR